MSMACPLADYNKHPLLRERLAGFRHHYGQPPEVRRAFGERLWGLRTAQATLEGRAVSRARARHSENWKKRGNKHAGAQIRLLG